MRGIWREAGKIVLAVLFFLSAAGMAKAVDFGDPTLAKILDTAAHKNPTIGAAVERVNQSRADVRGAAAEIGPRLVGGLGAQWNKDGPLSEDLSTSYRNSYTATLSFLQTIYAGGSLVANKRASEFALAGTRTEAARSYQNVMNSVKTYYYEVLRSLALLQVRTEAHELSQEHLRQTEALFRGGLVPMGDVLRVQVSVSQGELDQIRAANVLEVSWRTLERAVGATLSRSEVLKPVPGDRMFELKPPRYKVPENPPDKALSQRPELKTYVYYKKRADELARSAAGESLPRVQLSGQTGKTDNSFFPDNNDDWYVALNLQWTLYDSGKTASQVSRVKASARELLYQLDDLTAQVELEVATTEENLRSALLRLTVAENQAKKAEEDYRRTMKRYEAQMSTNLDVLDSRMSLIDSRLEYVGAVYDIAIAQANLVFAMGDDLPPEGLFQGGARSREVMGEVEK